MAATMGNSPFDRLPDEVLIQIVDSIQPDPERTVPIHNRAFLSVESFDIPPPSNADLDVQKFRLVCRRFAEIGEPALFAVVAVRFSERGLRKLDELLRWEKNLARHVRKFSYLVPYYYPNAENILNSDAQDGFSDDMKKLLRERIDEQNRILRNGEDVHVLRRAMEKFSSLQFVKLLRITDRLDNEFKRYIERHEGLGDWVESYWAPSCRHGSRALGRALLSTNVHLSRFYIPVLNVHSLRDLKLFSPKSLSRLADRLTCLTLVFDDVDDLDDRITELSPLFERVFRAAENMQAIHVGFPSYAPLDQPLEKVFHNVTWKKLLAFGVAGWLLDEQEIIELANRHSRTLRGLRLRDVYLRQGSWWRNVLESLKQENYLEWLSLRRIGYGFPIAGAEIPDDPDLGLSSDDSNDGDEQDDYTNQAGPSHLNHTNGHATDDEELGGYTSSDDDEHHGPNADSNEWPGHIMRQPEEPPPDSADRGLNGSREIHEDGHEGHQSEILLEGDLDEDRTPISRQKRKAWEKWALNPRRW